MIPVLLVWMRAELEYLARNNYDPAHRETKLYLYRNLEEIASSYVTNTASKIASDCALDVWRLKHDLIDKGGHDAHIKRRKRHDYHRCKDRVTDVLR